jgi:hypothetical protein
MHCATETGMLTGIEPKLGLTAKRSENQALPSEVNRTEK